jgi:hypothetical protein
MALFQPYRAIGCVSSAVPFSVQARGQDIFVTTVFGDAFHIYNVRMSNVKKWEGDGPSLAIKRRRRGKKEELD